MRVEQTILHAGCSVSVQIFVDILLGFIEYNFVGVAVLDFAQRIICSIDTLIRELFQKDDEILRIEAHHFREDMVLIDNDGSYFRWAFYPIRVHIEVFAWMNTVFILE
jgi:hypothetical protein